MCIGLMFSNLLILFSRSVWCLLYEYSHCTSLQQCVYVVTYSTMLHTRIRMFAWLYEYVRMRVCRVRAVLEGVEGAWSEQPVRFAVPPAAPDAPSDLALASPPTPCALALRWTPPQSNGSRVTDYTVRLTQCPSHSQVRTCVHALFVLWTLFSYSSRHTLLYSIYVS